MMTLVFAVVGGLIGAAIAALIGALFVMLAAKLVVNVKLGYGKAYVLSFLVFFASVLAGTIIMMVMGVDMMAADTSPLATHNLLGNLVGFLIGAWIYGSKISYDNGQAIGFGKGAIISLVLIIIGIIIGMILVALMGGGAMMATGAG